MCLMEKLWTFSFKIPSSLLKILLSSKQLLTCYICMSVFMLNAFKLSVTTLIVVAPTKEGGADLRRNGPSSKYIFVEISNIITNM